jgi:hypothetical protein
MKKRCGIRFGVKLLLLGIGLSLAGLGGAALAQGNQARMSVEPPAERVKKGGPDFNVNIVADDVANLAAFQFTLSYDPSIVKYVSVQGGDFLGSSGREQNCLEPRVDQGNPETLKFNCVTLGPPVSLGGKAGADGSGVLATITFSPVGSGETPLDLTEGRMIAAEIDARGTPVEMDTVVQGASLQLGSSGGGFAWALWGPVIGIVVAIVVVGLAILVIRLRARGSSSIGGI